MMNMLLYYCIGLLILCINTVFAVNPIILVPGTGGNQLEAKLVNKPKKHWYCYSNTKDYFLLWINIKSISNYYSLNCWADNMKLQWDMKNMKVSNSPGVLTRVPGFGETSTVEALDYFGLAKYMKPMIDHFVKLGFVKGKSIRAAPYDFRYSPDQLPHDYHQRLKSLIETTYEMNGNQRINLISHSYGCLVTLYFLSLQSKQWKNKYLKQWMPLAGPFGGTVQQLVIYASGSLEGVPGVLIKKEQIREEQRSSTSNLFMLPSYELWSKDDVVVRTNKRSYKLSDMDSFLNDVGFPEGITMRRYISNSTYLMRTSPGLPIHCMYGNIKNLIVKTLVFDKDFPDNTKSIINGDGDGTVNIESLTLCNNFSHQQKEPVEVSVFNGKNHHGMLSDETVLEKISSLL